MAGGAGEGEIRIRGRGEAQVSLPGLSQPFGEGDEEDAAGRNDSLIPVELR